MAIPELSSVGVRLSAIALLLAVFSAGALTGAAIYRWAAKDVRAEAMHPHHPGGPLDMLRELGLTEEQRPKAHAIFERYRPKLDGIMQEAVPKFRSVQDEIDSELMKILVPEQQTKLKEMRRRRQESQDRLPFGPPGMDRGRPPPPPPPPAP